MKVEKTPEITYSEVSHVELGEIADYVAKLTQVGALSPDANTEAYLRSLAGLPAIEETM
jgi:hypothetical protein